MNALRPPWPDRVLAVVSGTVMVFFALAYVTQPPVPGDLAAALTLAGLVVAHAALAVRSTHPRLAVGVAAVGGAVAAGAGFEAPVVALPFALYSTAVISADVRWPLWATAGAVVLFTAVRLTGTTGDGGGNLALRDAAVLLAALSVGAWARAHRRAGRQAVELEAAIRIADERLALSRELHELAAGALTATAVQAGAAAHLSASAPDTARAMIVDVAEQSRAAMSRLRALAAALRSGDLPSPHPVAPTVDALVELYGRAGLRVRGSWVSAAGEQPGPVTTRLIVQEALTNVLRHAGPVNVDVSVEEIDGAFTVRVANPVGGPGAAEPGAGEPVGGAGPAGRRGGLGLVGLHERVTTAGGSLTYGQRDGRFEVTAVVPTGGSAG